MQKQQLKVMISSTLLDLREHRRHVMEASLRQNMFPLRMEDLPASDDQAPTVSLKLVEEADVYVLVIGNRYGYVPKTDNRRGISVTEMEYNRASERKIRRLVFIMDPTHPITISDVETENNLKLKAFKDRILTEN